jgi:tRNA-specific 2-thiouridylase
VKKVVLGLSGGVDSAVAGLRLLEQGYEVYGLYLDIGLPEDVEAAHQAADFLGISLHVAEIRKLLMEKVGLPFAEAYLRGETPNPCILCNPQVKFKTLLAYCDTIGGDFVATGHYARTREGKLYRGRPENDQSYMLCLLSREQVERVLFPLGDLSKDQVRDLATQAGAPMAQKPDSMEICFIPDGDFGRFIEQVTPHPPGPGNFVDPEGRVLGRHKGFHRYTIGQRRGLGIAAGKRVFVSHICPETNEVVLSDGGGLFAQEVRVDTVNWLTDRPETTFSGMVRVRHSKQVTEATIVPTGAGVQICFCEPVRAPVPGQAACVYVDDQVVCGGLISTAVPATD